MRVLKFRKTAWFAKISPGVNGWMWYLIPFSYVIPVCWDGVGTSVQKHSFCYFSAHQLNCFFKHSLFQEAENSFQSVEGHFNQLISLSCAYHVGRGDVWHAKEWSQGVVPHPLLCVINGLLDWKVLERSVHLCPSFSSLTLMLFRLAAFQPFSWPPRDDRNIWFLLEPNETQRKSL